MSLKIKGKVAIVTGASKGIGAAIAEHLASEGALVIVNYFSSKEGADHIVSNITKKGGKALAVKANVAKEEEIKSLVKETVKAFGKIDILVNNAGVYEFAPLENISTDMFTKMFNLNVLGLLLLTQEAVKHFPAEGGSIINISSVASFLAPPESSIYSATKAAVDAITKSLSKELGPRRIRVNSVNPGLVETEGVRRAGFDEGEFKNHTVGETPLGRVGKPEDIAPTVTFLASEEGAWISGTTIVVSGGLR